MQLRYLADGCHAWTFDAKKVKALIEELCEGKVLNLFAGKNKLNVDETRVDISPEFSPDYCMDSAEFLAQNTILYNTILYDPPWNERKAKEYYNGKYIGRFQKMKEDIVAALAPGGKIISFGYKITYFGQKRGFIIEDLTVVNPFGDIKPYFISVERKVK